MKAIEDRRIATIKLTGVKAKSYNKIIDAAKCQKTIKKVAWIRLVIDPISYCLFYEKISFIVKYRFGIFVVSTKVVIIIVK